MVEVIDALKTAIRSKILCNDGEELANSITPDDVIETTSTNYTVAEKSTKRTTTKNNKSNKAAKTPKK
jgi:hypothetical protein